MLSGWEQQEEKYTKKMKNLNLKIKKILKFKTREPFK